MLLIEGGRLTKEIRHVLKRFFISKVINFSEFDKTMQFVVRKYLKKTIKDRVLRKARTRSIHLLKLICTLVFCPLLLRKLCINYRVCLWNCWAYKLVTSNSWLIVSNSFEAFIVEALLFRFLSRLVLEVRWSWTWIILCIYIAN